MGLFTSSRASSFLLLLLGGSLFLSAPINRVDNSLYSGRQSPVPSVNAQTSGSIYTIQKSDNTSLIFHVQVPGLQIWNETVNQTTFQRIRIGGPQCCSAPAGQGVLGNLGLPELPTLTRMIALPINSSASISVRDTIAPTNISNVYVYPVQIERRNSAVRNDTAPPFQYNGTFYGLFNAPWPLPNFNSSSVQQLRDVSVLFLTLFPVRWNPYVRVLTVHTQFDVNIIFRGGVGYFKGTPSGRAREASFNQLYNNTIMNNAAVIKYTGPLFPFTLNDGYCGEFLIITAPALTAPANSLANWKNSKGIITHVVDTTTTGTTDTQIRAYIQNLYNKCEVRPSYVLLLGDVNLIPTHYFADMNQWDNALNAGDLYFVEVAGNDILPDLHIGRLTVDTVDLATTVVNKIVNYEQHPPGLASFYQNMAFASYFQDDDFDGKTERGFVQTSEYVRNAFIGLYNIQRIYDAPAQSNPTTYADNTPIPAALMKPGFPWTGSAADISAAINAGTFLFFQRDHAWWNVWGSPSYGLGNIDALTNGNLLPVVISISCAAGIFDQKTVSVGYGADPNAVYFGQRMLRKSSGGAVAFIGDMRSSGSDINNDMSKGIFTGLLLAIILHALFGTPIRLGNLLTYAKLFLPAKGWAGASLNQEVEIYNLLGDPTLEMWTSQPPAATVFPPLMFALVAAASIAIITARRGIKLLTKRQS